MSFTPAEIAYLSSQRLGRLATVQPTGTLQVSPVCYTFDPATGCFDVAGMNMAASRKYRNVADNGRVAFVVDDLTSTDPWRVRCVEIRGHAEAIVVPFEPGDRRGGDIIRIHPERIISFGIDDDREPDQLTVHTRDAAAETMSLDHEQKPARA
ncbi:PPOX class F420-dependent oxidoreductase [Nocardia sp. NEAU-G5]|uniref:PPOX class F420-dependent oxidoreductase n=1 Tax=Nocardia albiluteola TaxID=2842303 RepID=A0ABS6AQN8_9NOCA|nr:PPOX class F420-dependent oxidoreductase [Nocardia albiluteola]MBU3060303.1 PPOX class F420-dependent oxidoreductase [Nocardia albiluteola]